MDDEGSHVACASRSDPSKRALAIVQEDFNLRGKSKCSGLSRDGAPRSKAGETKRREKASANGARDSGKQGGSRCQNASMQPKKGGFEVVDLTEEQGDTRNSTEEEHGGRTRLEKSNRGILGKSGCSVASQPRRIITVEVSTDSEGDESSSDDESSVASSPPSKRHATKVTRANKGSAECLAGESSRKGKGAPIGPRHFESLSTSNDDDSSDESVEGEDEDFIPLVRPTTDLSGGSTADPPPHTPMGLDKGSAADGLAQGVAARSQDKVNRGGTQVGDKSVDSAGLLLRVWPSASRFYRTVLRWRYCPQRRTIDGGAYTTSGQEELEAMPTSFRDFSHYQTVLSHLVIKEGLGSIQHTLTEKVGTTLRSVQGQIFSASHLETTRGVPSGSSSSSSSLSDSKLYCLHARVAMADPGPNETVFPPFSGGELVALWSPQWCSHPETAVLGVVHTWDPVYDLQSKKRPWPHKLVVWVRILVCTCEEGGDGHGGRGGWLKLSDLEVCRAIGKSGQHPDHTGVELSITGIGSLMSASREFQAIMSTSELPPHLRDCLLDPRLVKKGKGKGKGKRKGKENGEAEEEEDDDDDDDDENSDLHTPPSRVPAQLWKALVGTFNRSQLLAMRHVIKDSENGFTLLQGPPGTGKTRTIMGIVGLLLAGASGKPKRGEGEVVADVSYAIDRLAAQVRASRDKMMLLTKKQRKRLKPLAKDGVKIFSPVDKHDRHTRVLVVAPSNAAVNELVIRLCEVGVPGRDGRPFFPKVVRVGTERKDDASAELGDSLNTRPGAVSAVQAVSLSHLAEVYRRRSGGNYRDCRLDVLLQAQIVCTTLSGSGSAPLVESLLMAAKGPPEKGKKRMHRDEPPVPILELTFDAVVMDEAAQAVEPSSLIPLKFNPRAVVLVGDPAQLPATIFSQRAQDANYGQSLFQRLQRGGLPMIMLDTQYRMHPSIVSFPSKRFYDGILRSAPSVLKASYQQPFHGSPRFAPYLFHNVSNGELIHGTGGTSCSCSNMQEVEYIMSLLSDLVRSFPKIDFNGRIGVIAPYRNQIQALQRSIWKTGLSCDGVEISTVDGFQGREKDIIILSCVRAPRARRRQETQKGSVHLNGSIGFVDDWRRLNVAITRAKYAMWIVGHAGVLKQSSDWKELINDCRKRGIFVDELSGNPSFGGSSGGSGSSGNGAHGKDRRDDRQEERREDRRGERREKRREDRGPQGMEQEANTNRGATGDNLAESTADVLFDSRTASSSSQASAFPGTNMGRRHEAPHEASHGYVRNARVGGGGYVDAPGMSDFLHPSEHWAPPPQPVPPRVPFQQSNPGAPPQFSKSMGHCPVASFPLANPRGHEHEHGYGYGYGYEYGYGRGHGWPNPNR